MGRPMTDADGTVRLGSAQVADGFFDPDATLEKDLRYIREAGELGIDVLVFPENHLGGPYHWFSRGRDVEIDGAVAGVEAYYEALHENAITVPGPETERLGEAARDAGTVVVMGAVERVGAPPGRLYNAQVFIGGDGRLLGSRRKLVPTLSGRLFFDYGSGQGLRTFESAVGPVGGLLCGEHTNPLAVFAVLAQGEQLHAASWPALAWHDAVEDWVGIRTRYHAFVGKVPTAAATGVVTEALADRIGRPEWAGRGGASAIVSPTGEYLAGPKTDGEEGLVHADVDLRTRVRAKATHDILGHYNRFDVFELTVDRTEPPALTVVDGPTGGRGSDADPRGPPVRSSGGDPSEAGEVGAADRAARPRRQDPDGPDD